MDPGHRRLAIVPVSFYTRRSDESQWSIIIMTPLERVCTWADAELAPDARARLVERAEGMDEAQRAELADFLKELPW